MTIVDVAAKANVSKTTVSRVINGNPTVTAEVARRVKEAMAELGYIPPVRRRGPKPKMSHTPNIRKGTLGFLLFGRGRELLQFSYTARILSGFMESATENDLQTVIIEMPDKTSVPKLIQNQSLDGIAIIGTNTPPKLEMENAFHPLPCVWIGGTASDMPIADQVAPHTPAIGRIASNYLIECGCRRTAFLNHDPTHKSLSTMGVAFNEHMTASGIPTENIVIERNDTNEAAMWNNERVRKDYEKLVEQAFSGSESPDGIFAPTDQQVAMVHQLLHERGLVPGQDVTTISCNNDQQWLATLHPQPATIDPRAETLGQEAAQRLAWRLNHPQNDPTIIMVAPKLIKPTVT